MTVRKIYVASSWRNKHQPNVVIKLRELGHLVYDFKNPIEGNYGFSWAQVREDYVKWDKTTFLQDLHKSDIAKEGFRLDMQALKWADTCVLLLPSGRSAHLEAGYAIGQGKQTIIYVDDDKFEPELMYLMADKITDSLDEVYRCLE